MYAALPALQSAAVSAAESRDRSATPNYARPFSALGRRLESTLASLGLKAPGQVAGATEGGIMYTFASMNWGY
jgi:hypothetical protein